MKIPIEKCLSNVPNIFTLILVASRRARALSHGKNPQVPISDAKLKTTLIALEEISAGVINQDVLSEEQPQLHSSNNLGFTTPGPLPPLSALSRVMKNGKEDEDSDLANLEDAELGLKSTSVIADE